MHSKADEMARLV